MKLFGIALLAFCMTIFLAWVGIALLKAVLLVGFVTVVWLYFKYRRAVSSSRKTKKGDIDETV